MPQRKVPIPVPLVPVLIAGLLAPAIPISSQTWGQPEENGVAARPRIRELGVSPGILPTGPLNAITDVEGVTVGHESIVEGDHVRTGVTAILPHDGNLFRNKVAGAVYVGNGFGKAAGFLQVRELGTIETPIILTNTLSVGRCVESLVRWTLEQDGNKGVTSVNALVGETNDGYLNDIGGMHVGFEHVRGAIEAARGGPVPEGCVGAGVGTRALGFKAGIGTASRRLPESLGGYTVGVLVQANFGGALTIDGVRVGERMGRHAFRTHLAREQDGPEDDAGQDDNDEQGSCMIVIATNAPLDARNLERLAARSMLGLGRAGGYMSNGSGDFAIAFSTAQPIQQGERVHDRRVLDNAGMSPLFLACVEATEEAVYNSIVKATTMHGREGRVIEAIDIDELRALLRDR